MSWRRCKTAPRVRDGRVQHKNNWHPTPDNFGLRQVSIERCRPGRGYRHVLRCSDVYTFVGLLPVWDQLSTRLNQILLAPGSPIRLGWFRRGIVAVCAMPHNLVVEFDRECFLTDVDFFDRVGVPYRFYSPVPDSDEESWREVSQDEDWSRADCQFTTATARCFQLLRVLTHEFGHHHDRITNPKGWCSRGEDFAERYGQQLEAKVWPRYLEMFGDPRRGS
jgi:hypothetical protein